MKNFVKRKSMKNGCRPLFKGDDVQGCTSVAIGMDAESDLGGFKKNLNKAKTGKKMHQYNSRRETTARTLRKQMTDSELKLWSRIRRKQIAGLQFYRQRPIGNYIVDFYCPGAQIVLEVDGSQHVDKLAVQNDQYRNNYLRQQGIKLLRFNNLEIVKELDAVVEKVHQTAVSRI